MCLSIWLSGYGLLHEKVSVTFDKRETFGIFMQYEIELMFTLGIIAFKFICTNFFLSSDYDVENWYWYAFHYNSKFTLTSKIAWNKHGRYKEGSL